jgi:hypothetical protein
MHPFMDGVDRPACLQQKIASLEKHQQELKRDVAILGNLEPIER